MKGTFGKPFRLTAATAGVVLLALVVTAIGPSNQAAAGEPATNQTAGTASATATSYKVNPTTASLSIGITFGISLAGYTNQVAQAESRGIDLGIIGSTLAGEGCDGGDPAVPAEDQPQPLRADSRTPGSSQPKTENERYLPLITKTVRADPTPFSQSDTTSAGLTDPGAFINLGAAHSQAITRLVDGTREAVATVEIGKVGIAGVIEFEDLRWQAKAQSGKVDKTDGTFTIGSLKVLGQNVPSSDAPKAVESANAVLQPLGLQVVYPKARTAAGILFVDPLVIRVVPSTTRDSISQTVLGAAQPVRQNLYDALLAQDCGNATYITVSDIAVGSLTGAGSFSLELGGANAKAEALKTTNFLTLRPLTPSGLNSSFGDSFDRGSLDSTPSLGGTKIPAPATTGTKPARRSAPIASVAKGSRGGPMAVVGLIGLIALGVVADRDRRLMRRAQRLTATATEA